MSEDRSRLVIVSCPDHHDKLVAGLWKLFSAERRVDFFLQLDGRSIRAHQLVLDVFLSLDKLGQRETAVTLTPDHLDCLLEFAYNGQVAVRQDQLDGLLRVARQLDFRMLADAVEATALTGSATDIAPASTRRRRTAAVRSGKAAVNYDETSDRESVTSDRKQTVSSRKRRTTRSGSRVKAASEEKASLQSSDESFHPDDAGDGGGGESGREDCGDATSTPDHEAASHLSGNGETIPAKQPDTRPTKKSGGAGRRRPIWKCKQCKYQSIRKALFQLHLSKHDPSIRTFKCDSCSKPFACEVSLRRHKCSTKTSVSNATVSVDEGEGEAKTDAAVYQCSQCDYKCHVESFYLLHRASKHDHSIPVFRCSSCPRKFLREESLRCHKCSPAYASTAAGPKTHACPHCDYKTRDKYRFTIHASKHDPTVTVLRCDDCRKAFFSHEALARHKQQHQSYRCPHCNHETQKSWRHYDHLFSVHGVNTKGETLPKMRCSHCDFSCRTEGLLKNHIVAKHSGTRPYNCDLCTFSSCHKSAIPQHKKIVHFGIRAHMCEQCGYRAVSQSALNKHNLSHSGEKPFQCQQCEKAYSDITALKRHIGTHGKNEKPFICHVCAYASNRRSNLNVHLRKVHKAPVEPPSFKYAPKSDYSLYSM